LFTIYAATFEHPMNSN